MIGRGLQYASVALILITVCGAAIFDRLAPGVRDLDDGDYRGYWEAMIVNFAILAAGLMFFIGVYFKSKTKEHQT